MFVRLATAVSILSFCHGCGAPVSGPGQPTVPGVTLVAQPAKVGVAAGERAEITIRNTGSQTWRYRHPGGSNGCAAFGWSIRIESASGTTYSPRPPGPRICTTVLVPPQSIEVEPGGVAGTVTIDTAIRWFDANTLAKPGGDPPPGVNLPVGTYTVFLTSGSPQDPVRAELTIN